MSDLALMDGTSVLNFLLASADLWPVGSHWLNSPGRRGLLSRRPFNSMQTFSFFTSSRDDSVIKTSESVGEDSSIPTQKDKITDMKIFPEFLPFVNLAFLLRFSVPSSTSISSSLSSSLPLFSRLFMMLLWWKGSRLKIRRRLISIFRFEPVRPGLDIRVEVFPWNRPLDGGKNLCCCSVCEPKQVFSVFFSWPVPLSCSFFFSFSIKPSFFSLGMGRLSELQQSGKTGRWLWGQGECKPAWKTKKTNKKCTS